MSAAGPARAHPRHPGLPEAGDRLQGHHAAAAGPGGAGRGGAAAGGAGRGRWTVELVVAAEARGFILGAALARELGVGLRAGAQAGQAAARDGLAPSTCSSTASTRWRCTPTRWPHGARVLVHDDLLATGGTARALCELVEGCGARGRRLRASSSSWPSSAAARSWRATTSTRSSPTTTSDAARARAPCVGAPPEAVWRLVGDPYHLPRWWPRVAARRGRDDARLDDGVHDRRGAPGAGRLPRSRSPSRRGAARWRRSSRARRSSGCCPRRRREVALARRRGRRRREVTLELRSSGRAAGRASRRFLLRARDAAAARRGAGRARGGACEP